MTRSPIALAALATLAVPALDVVATRPPVRTTTDYQTVGVLDARGRHWIVRMPRTAAAGASLEGEVALLERLASEADAGRLPFDVERPAGFTTLPEGGRAMVTRELPGRTVDAVDIDERAGLADHVGVALAALHGLSPDLVGDTGLPVYDMATYRRRRLHEVDEASRTGDVPPELIHRWEAALESDDLWPGGTTVVHGDLDAELVRVAGDRVVAMTLFGDAHVGDPAEDFAWLVSAVEPETFDQVRASYEAHTGAPADPFLLDRAQLASELLLTRWLMFGRRTEDAAVVTDARHMLIELAHDVADAPPIGAEVRAMLAESAPSVTAADADGETDSLLAEDDWDEDLGTSPGPAATSDSEWGATSDSDSEWGAASAPVEEPADEPVDSGAPDETEPGEAGPTDAEPQLDPDAWPAFDVHPGDSQGVPEPTAATADLTEEYERWRREGHEF